MYPALCIPCAKPVEITIPDFVIKIIETKYSCVKDCSDILFAFLEAKRYLAYRQAGSGKPVKTPKKLSILKLSQA
jgi:hypothetical protein